MRHLMFNPSDALHAVATRNDPVAQITLQLPYTVHFRRNGRRLMYIIDRGGLRDVGGFPRHETPSGSFQWSESTSMQDIDAACAELGAHVSA